MQITISVRHGQLSESTQEKIRGKVEKLNRYFERLTAIEVTVDLEHKEQPSVELLLSAEHKHDFVARDQSGDLLASVDQVVHKMEPQLKKYKERLQDHHRSNGLRKQLAEGNPEETQT